MEKAVYTDKSTANDEPEVTEYIFTRQADFLRDIHDKFLKTVDPVESGLTDILRQENCMCSDDEQEIEAENTRKNKARKFWKFLHGVQASVFKRHCLPALRKLYPHVVGQAVFSGWDGPEACLRHFISKTSLRRFADVFIATQACTLDEYNTITEGDQDRTKWDLVFSLCERNGDNIVFVNQVTLHLTRAQVKVPDNFPALLSAGFPCTCNPAISTLQIKQEKGESSQVSGVKRQLKECMQIDVANISSPKRQRLEVETESQVCEPTSVIPVSTANAIKDTETASVSHTHQTLETNREREDVQFETEQQKDSYLLELEKTSKAITKACMIKPLCTKLAGIKDSLNTLKETVKLNPLTTTKLAFSNLGKIYRLQKKATETYQTLKDNYKVVSELKSKTEAGILEFDFELPVSRKKELLEKHKMLANEIKEAAVFVNQSESLFTAMAIPDNPRSPPAFPEPKPLPPRVWGDVGFESDYLFQEDHENDSSAESSENDEYNYSSCEDDHASDKSGEDEEEDDDNGDDSEHEEHSEEDGEHDDDDDDDDDVDPFQLLSDLFENGVDDDDANDNNSFFGDSFHFKSTQDWDFSDSSHSDDSDYD